MELRISLHKSNLPLHRQIYQEIRNLILSRNFKSGQRLPSTRTLLSTERRSQFDKSTRLLPITHSRGVLNIGMIC